MIGVDAHGLSVRSRYDFDFRQSRETDFSQVRAGSQSTLGFDAVVINRTATFEYVILDSKFIFELRQKVINAMSTMIQRRCDLQAGLTLG